VLDSFWHVDFSRAAAGLLIFGFFILDILLPIGEFSLTSEMTTTTAR
jgi:hypothetical protein